MLTLLTDFGTGSPYVAAMKGVLLSLHPAAQIVDLTHEVPPQDVRYAAIVLDDVAERFPAGTLHVAVVDPGVGTARALLYAQLGTQHYLAPDNGLLSRVALRRRPTRIIELTESRHWLTPLSATFHGRDILAPVAARLSLGLDPTGLGTPRQSLVMLDWPQPQASPGRIDGHVLWIDHFGNLMTNITAETLAAAGAPLDEREKGDRYHLPERPEGCFAQMVPVPFFPGAGASLTTVCCGQTAVRHVRTYGEAASGELVSLFGSSERLELAVVGGNAAARLAATVDAPVRVTW